MSRLNAVPRDTLPADQRRFYDAVLAIRRRPVSGPFIVLMNGAPDLASRFAHLGHYFHSRGQADESVLTMRVRGFASLVGSRALDAPYEWSAWVNWALEAGVSQDTVDAIRENRPLNLNPEEALIADFCGQLLSGNHRVSDATFGKALDHFGAQGLVELVMTLGYFAMIALPLNAFEIEMTDAQKKLRKAFKPLEINGSPWSGPWAGRSGMPSIAGNVSATPRLPKRITHDDVAPEHQLLLDRVIRTRGWISGVYGVLMHSPDAADRTAVVGSYLLFESVLPPAIRALVWLVGARELDCAYTWHSGVLAARDAGIDELLISAIEKGGAKPALSNEQDAVIDFCHQLLRGNHHIDDAVYRRAIDNLGTKVSVLVAAMLGYIAMISLAANAFEIAPEEGATGPSL